MAKALSYGLGGPCHGLGSRQQPFWPLLQRNFLSVVNRMEDGDLFLNMFRHQPATSYAAGQTVFEAGSKGESMFVVVGGEVEIRLKDAQLEVAAAGSIFGEMALVDDSPRSATVVARTPCRLMEIDRRRFDFLASETPYFARAVMRVMADRIRKSNARVTSA